jgi:hypothetical protein
MEWFLKLAGGALALTGLAKAFSAIGAARALDTADPLIGLPFRQLLLLVGLAELLIAFFCLFTDKRRFSLVGPWRGFPLTSLCTGSAFGSSAGIGPAAAWGA